MTAIPVETSETIGPEAQFATLRSVSYGSRPPWEVALDLSIGSLATAAAQGDGKPAGDDAILARAEAFIGFAKKHGAEF